MASYSYLCPKCGNSQQVIHKVAETPYIKCNKCVAVMIRAIQPTPQKKV